MKHTAFITDLRYLMGIVHASPTPHLDSKGNAMRRMLISSVFVLVGLVSSVTAADLGQACWRLQDGGGNPLLDVVRVAVTQAPSTNPVIFELHGTVTADPLYQEGGAGMATQNSMNLSTYRITLTLTHDTSFFSNNRSCGLTLIVDPTSLNGTWSEQCAGGSATPQPPISGLVVSFSCPALGAMARAQQEVVNYQMNAFGELKAAGLGNFESLAEEPR